MSNEYLREIILARMADETRLKEIQTVISELQKSKEATDLVQVANNERFGKLEEKVDASMVTLLTVEVIVRKMWKQMNEKEDDNKEEKSRSNGSSNKDKEENTD
ncbi:uncharacterized protein G2W53_001143 [Senna tora]|uniref:Uncharacterized protein n=1 Tax=Senna tora TaxID=362788 RepID=A0A834XFC2_9FABA|nr:uncharacterized protein G2W53_001143 [Senna tora]